ncbi:RNA polymerase sigma factor RpoE [Castellaniella sp.]|uniref:RNA polymerase sigma factor RpoE n=1 Tax=Castellaniella sp. TaxID=1955812 RepID=UPI00355E82C7
MAERDVDQALVRRVQGGERQAFDLLVIKYQRRIMRLLARLVHDPAEVEDLAQDVFIKAWRALPQFRGESAFYTWLYRIALNTARNWLATRKRQPIRVDAPENEDGETFSADDSLTDYTTPESAAVSREIVDTINHTIEDLPEDQRTAIVLREIEGMTYEEIAQIMQCPVGTVRSRIYRAREAIAHRLRPVLGNGADRRW